MVGTASLVLRCTEVPAHTSPAPFTTLADLPVLLPSAGMPSPVPASVAFSAPPKPLNTEGCDWVLSKLRSSKLKTTVSLPVPVTKVRSSK